MGVCDGCRRARINASDSFKIMKYVPALEEDQQFRDRSSLSLPRICVSQRHLRDVFEVKSEMNELFLSAPPYCLVGIRVH
jgi:hypothetical protein